MSASAGATTFLQKSIRIISKLNIESFAIQRVLMVPVCYIWHNHCEDHGALLSLFQIFIFSMHILGLLSAQMLKMSGCQS